MAMDRLAPRERSELMRRVRGANTVPERIVQAASRALGHKPSTNMAGLAGTPDLVFPKMRTAVFVHGCFWHRHSCPRGQSVPRTRSEFWKGKFTQNVMRDRRMVRRLRNEGWH